MLQNGTDLKGEINGEKASGRGQVLTDAHGKGGASRAFRFVMVRRKLRQADSPER